MSAYLPPGARPAPEPMARAPQPAAPDLIAVARLRAQLWERGYRPVPLLSANDPDPKKAGKAPVHKDWTNRARRNPPEAAKTPALEHLANTGVLCDGLRVIDADVDDASTANVIEELAIEHLGAAPTRRRDNSARFAMLYRAAEGEPRKLDLVGAGHTKDHACKIEALGKGQQFVAYGGHVSGGTLSWTVEPLDTQRDQLPAVTEPQIAAFLAAVAPIIGAEAPAPQKPKTTKGSNGAAGPALALLEAALALIPAEVADDYDKWIRVGAALHHESQGSDDGMQLWADWAAKGSKFDAAETEKRWASFANGGGDAKVAAATIFHLAKPYGWHPPDPADDPGYIAALEADAQAEAARTARPPPGHGNGQDHPAPAGSAGAFGQDEADGEYGRTDAEPNPGAGAKSRFAGDAGQRPRRKRRNDEAPPYTPTDTTDLWDPWDDPPPPAWPSAVLAPQVEDTLALMSLRDGIDIGTLAMTHVAASSAAAPKDARFFAYNNRATGWCVPPIFWPMIVGDSGFRKTILGQFFAPLRDVQATLWRPYAIALRNWYAAPPKGRGHKPTEPHSFIVDDFTVEALQRILAATTRGSAVVTDELAGLFEFDRYRQGSGAAGSAARGFLLAAYEDEARAVHRISRDAANIEHTGLSVFGGIQGDRLADFKDLAKDGLLQRFAPIRTPPAVAARPAIDVGRGIEHMHAAVARLCHLNGKNYTTTQDGTALIQNTEQTAFGYATISDYAPGWPGFCRKIHGTHARLALILHMLETPSEPVIPTDTVQRAHRLVHSFVLQHATDFYASIPGSHRERLRDIAGWLLTRQGGNAAPNQWERIVASDLTNNVKACRPLTSKGIAEVLDPFVTRGWLTPETDFPGNRAWFFDPAIRTAMAERQVTERERRAAIRAEIDSLAAERRA